MKYGIKITVSPDVEMWVTSYDTSPHKPKSTMCYGYNETQAMKFISFNVAKTVSESIRAHHQILKFKYDVVEI